VGWRVQHYVTGTMLPQWKKFFFSSDAFNYKKPIGAYEALALLNVKKRYSVTKMAENDSAIDF
jgi:hypothetical protein